VADAVGDVIWRDDAVPIHADDNLSFGFGNENIQASGDDLARILENVSICSLRRPILEQFTRAIIGHPVSNKHFNVI